MTPRGWKNIILDNICTTVTSGSRDWAKYYAESGSKFMRMTNLNRDGIKLKLEDLKYVNVSSDSADGKRTNLEYGDILMSITAELGKIGYIPNNFGEAFINQHTALIRTNTHKADSKYLAYLLSSNKMNYVTNSLNDAGAKAGLNLSTIRTLPILLPPRHEQTKIANILSTWDKAIEATEKLIKNSQAQKKALMQKLFVQKIRFKDKKCKDFPDWESKKLSDISSFCKGKGISKADVVRNGKTRCICYGELYTKYQEVTYDIYSSTNLPAGNLEIGEYDDVIIPCSGETHIDIATATCIRQKEVAYGGDITVIRTDLDGAFLSYYLNSAKKIEIARLSQGSSVVHLYSIHLKTLKVDIPCRQEQQKIAAILSSADKEIELLQQKHDFLKQEKKALMQQLLTGKRRVKVDETEQ